VSNPLGAAGGADRESIDHATRFGPLAFRSGQRAVTLSDFESLAQQIGGVAKVRGVSRDWNHVDLYIAPESNACGPVPEDLRTRIIAAFEEKRMVTSIIRVLDATCVPIDIAMDVVFDRHFRVDVVRQSVDTAVRSLLAFHNVDFARPVYLSSVYGAVEVLPGVTALTVTTFARQASLVSGGAPIDIGIGRIDIGDFEIPSLGNLTISMLENRR